MWSLFALLALVGTNTVRAQSPAAIVEEVTGQQATVRFMDYVTSGTVIRLGNSDTLTLGYMRSCWRESIRGGVVTIGVERSKVVGGKVNRQKVECDGGRMRLSTAQASQSGVMVFRGGLVTGSPVALPAAQLTLYGLSPLVEMSGGGKLVIERLDAPGERQEVEIDAAPLTPGYYDFATEGRELSAGGLYRASAQSGELVFKVDALAKPGKSPIIGRLLKL